MRPHLGPCRVITDEVHGDRNVQRAPPRPAPALLTTSQIRGQIDWVVKSIDLWQIPWVATSAQTIFGIGGVGSADVTTLVKSAIKSIEKVVKSVDKWSNRFTSGQID